MLSQNQLICFLPYVTALVRRLTSTCHPGPDARLRRD
jgi:hypothetical protein